MNVKQMAISACQRLAESARKHSPEILTAMGVSGMIASTVMAVQATPKALQKVKDKEEAEGRKLTKIEVVKECWKCYIPTVITTTVSAACIIGANSVHSRRNAALAAAYSFSETALRDYKDKTLEAVGEKKEQEIRNEVAKEQVQRVERSDRDIFLTGDGDELCFDPLSGRYFRSSTLFLKKCENVLNRRMRDEMTVSLNEFYREIHLPEIDSCIGEMLCWDIDDGRGYIDLELEWVVDPPDETGVKCCVINHGTPPTYLP